MARRGRLSRLRPLNELGWRGYPLHRELVRRVLGRTSYRLSERYPGDLGPEVNETIRIAAPFSMTSPDRLAATILATEHVVRHDIPGAVVECGVWRGGSMLAVAETLRRLGATDRELHLFDTFAGMTEPAAADVTRRGADAREIWAAGRRQNGNAWCAATVDEVREVLARSEYPEERLHFAVGPVEETLPRSAPDEIALLRLDTDFYESTRHELEHLYPRLARGGILIVDDYGEWIGARKAVDEYFTRTGEPIFLSRTDNTARIAVKP